MKILVVEDEPTTRVITTKLLERQGFSVTTASLADEALELLSGSDDPPIILVDWHMPKMSGPSFLESLRAKFPLQSYYVLMATEMDDPDAILAAFEKGVSDFVPKPITAANLWSRVRVALHRIALEERANQQGYQHSMLQIHSLSSGILAHFVHEISNPLSMVSYAAELLNSQHGNLSSESAERLISKLNQSVGQVKEIISNERQRLVSGVQSKKELIAVAEVVEEAVATMAFRSKGIRVELENYSHLNDCKVFANRIELFQVLINLIANALDAVEGQEAPWIKIIFQIKPWGVQISVKNSGPALSREVGVGILSAPKTTKAGHSGIGIRLCQSILSDHGGRLEFSADDGFTTFSVFLPIKLSDKVVP